MWVSLSLFIQGHVSSILIYVKFHEVAFFCLFFLFYFSFLTPLFDFEESFLSVYMLGIRSLFVL